MLLLFVGVPGFTRATDESTAQAAILLTARAQLTDPSFGGATVLVTNNVASGPFGVILNRPTSITLGHVFPDLADTATRDEPIYFGGPVDIGGLSFLFRSQAPPDGHAVKILADVYLSRDRQLLRTLLERGATRDSLRVFIGYAGWEPEQLENEIARGDWKPEAASADAIFARRHEVPWPASPAPKAQRIRFPPMPAGRTTPAAT